MSNWPSTTSSGEFPLQRNSRFPKTKWLVIHQAVHSTEAERENALTELCQSYWKPLYAWMRFRGYSVDECKDGVQGFFAHLFEKKSFANADSNKGKFRNFLVTSLRNFLENERIRADAKKRGGGATHISYDQDEGDDFYAAFRQTFSGESDATRAFDRSWALSIMKKAEATLLAEFVGRDRAHVFEALRPFLDESNDRKGYGSAAASIKMSESTFRVALYRLRRRFADLIVESVRETVSTEEEMEEEMRTLYAALRND